MPGNDIGFCKSDIFGAAKDDPQCDEPSNADQISSCVPLNNMVGKISRQRQRKNHQDDGWRVSDQKNRDIGRENADQRYNDIQHGEL